MANQNSTNGNAGERNLLPIPIESCAFLDPNQRPYESIRSTASSTTGPSQSSMSGPLPLAPRSVGQLQHHQVQQSQQQAQPGLASNAHVQHAASSPQPQYASPTASSQPRGHIELFDADERIAIGVLANWRSQQRPEQQIASHAEFAVIAQRSKEERDRQQMPPPPRPSVFTRVGPLSGAPEAEMWAAFDPQERDAVRGLHLLKYYKPVERDGTNPPSGIAAQQSANGTGVSGPNGPSGIFNAQVTPSEETEDEDSGSEPMDIDSNPPSPPPQLPPTSLPPQIPAITETPPAAFNSPAPRGSRYFGPPGTWNGQVLAGEKTEDEDSQETIERPASPNDPRLENVRKWELRPRKPLKYTR